MISTNPNKIWLQLPIEHRKRILANVWCGHCRKATMIVQYIIEGDKQNLILKGKCKTCDQSVARVIE